MAKKSFMDSINPAMQFITTPEQPEAGAPEAAPAQEAEKAGALTPPPGYKVDPRFIETKSRRLQVLIQPSLHKRVQKVAKQKKRSVNDMISVLLEAALEVEEAKS